VIALLAMAGAVLLGEYLAGAVIALMLASGRALEAHAAGRAGRELEALLARTPRTATSGASWRRSLSARSSPATGCWSCRAR
jgi:cation transport ATPase